MYLCGRCGLKYGKNHAYPLGVTWWEGECSICNGDSNGYVTDERDFGYVDKDKYGKYFAGKEEK